MVKLKDFLYSEFFRCEALKWSCFDKVFQVMCDFSKKSALIDVAPEPLAIWNKKLEGLELWLLKKVKKISSQDMYSAAPKHLSEFFSIVRNSDGGSCVVFLGSQIYIRCWW
jgi:hypothetical protein